MDSGQGQVGAAGRVHQLSEVMGLPQASSYQELFNWHHFNAHKFFESSALRQNFSKLLQDYDTIELHESFAGTGNAGRALHHQFCALKANLEKGTANPSTWAGPVTVQLTIPNSKPSSTLHLFQVQSIQRLSKSSLQPAAEQLR